MYIAYVDESGDPGHNVAITRYFTLSGIIIADSNWKSFLDRVRAFRKGLKRDFRLPLKADVRATDLWRSKGDFKRLKIVLCRPDQNFQTNSGVPAVFPGSNHSNSKH